VIRPKATTGWLEARQADATASKGAPWVCLTVAREEKQMTYDTDDLTIDDLDDKVFDAAKALFAAIQFSAPIPMCETEFAFRDQGFSRQRREPMDALGRAPRR